MVIKPLNKLKAPIALLLLVAVLVGASACSSTKDEAKAGGVLNIGAEQEPDCLDFLDLCSGSSWGFWMVGVQTLPRAFSVEQIGDKKEWETKVTDLLAKEPVLETEPVQKMTYEINPKAVWSDGVAITGKDFVYTADQLKNGENIYDQSGYKDIDTVVVDPKDELKVVVTMKQNYAGWKALFGGNFGVIPSHILEGKDRNALTKDGYTFSGGPFKLESWKKGESITLVPNDKYWGDKPKVDKVVFKIITDTIAGFKSFKANEVSAIYPQPSFDVIDALASGFKDNKAVNGVTGATEALWINNDAAPFDSLKVRQAFGYSLDRDAIVKTLFGGIGVDKAVQSFVAPVLKEYADKTGFSDYKLDAKKAGELLTSDGWKKNADGIYAKNGKLLEYTLHTTEGNARRKVTMESVQKQMQDVGWKVNLAPVPAGDLFGQILPKGNYQVGIYAQQLTVLDPSNCTLFCSNNIPTEANGNAGNNWTRTNNAEADKLLLKVDNELDAEKRITASKAAEKLLAQDATSFPLDPLPNILLWKKSVGGDVVDNPIMGPFWKMNTWTVK